MTYGYDADEARQLSRTLDDKALQCASAPDIQVHGGVRMTFTEHINESLRNLRDTSNKDKIAYAKWMHTYARNLELATRSTEAFEEGLTQKLATAAAQVEQVPTHAPVPAPPTGKTSSVDDDDFPSVDI